MGRVVFVVEFRQPLLMVFVIARDVFGECKEVVRWQRPMSLKRREIGEVTVGKNNFLACRLPSGKAAAAIDGILLGSDFHKVIVSTSSCCVTVCYVT